MLQLITRPGLMLVTLLALAPGCGGDEKTCDTTEHENVDGAWMLQLEIMSSCDSDEVGEEQSDSVTVHQQDEAITIDVSYWAVSELRGSICGDTFSARASASTDILGCAISENVSVHGTVAGDTVAGEIVYNASIPHPEDCLGYYSCRRTYSFTGSQIAP